MRRNILSDTSNIYNEGAWKRSVGKRNMPILRNTYMDTYFAIRAAASALENPELLLRYDNAIDDRK
jgi:hypothetical protein